MGHDWLVCGLFIESVYVWWLFGVAICLLKKWRRYYYQYYYSLKLYSYSFIIIIISIYFILLVIRYERIN